MKGVTFIIKPVGAACNLVCDYCYFGVGCRECGRSGNTRISRVVLERFISEYLILSQDRFDFIWHGGESLLAGIDFFKDAVRLQKVYSRNGQNIFNGIQTNATLLNEDWASFFKENHFHVGVSLDGPEYIHNAHRRYPSGEGSFADTMRGIALLREYGVNFATLTVLSKESLGHEGEIFDFFLRNGIYKIDLLPCVAPETMESGKSVGAVAPGEFAGSVAKMFDLWWQLDNPEVRVRLFENVLLGFLGSKPHICKFAGTCARQCTLDYNGDVYPCDKFVGMKDFMFGNIAESNLADILDSDARQRFITQVRTFPSDCVNCRWKAICNAGCVYHRYIRRGILADKTYFCSFRRLFFQHVQMRVCNTAMVEG